MGSRDDPCVTFSVADEDHTLGNAVRFMLNQDPRVSFCGYTVPHPSDSRVNIRVQTTGDPARLVLKDALQKLMDLCDHVTSVFDAKFEEFHGEGKRTESSLSDQMDVDGKGPGTEDDEEEDEEEDDEDEDEE